MILHTIFPAEMIFPSDPAEYQTLEIKNGSVYYSETDGQKRVERLVSTDPHDYLNPKYFPGAIM